MNSSGCHPLLLLLLFCHLSQWVESGRRHSYQSLPLENVQKLQTALPLLVYVKVSMERNGLWKICQWLPVLFTMSRLTPIIALEFSLVIPKKVRQCAGSLVLTVGSRYWEMFVHISRMAMINWRLLTEPSCVNAFRHRWSRIHHMLWLKKRSQGHSVTHQELYVEICFETMCTVMS